MANVQIIRVEIAASNDIDRARVAATAEEDIRRYMIEDNEDLDEDPPASVP